MAKTECKYGHPYDMTYVQKRGNYSFKRRGCSICRRHARQRYEIKKLARNA